MNLKLQKLISLFNERKNFFNGHPESYRFMKDTFGKELPEGTEIQIIVKKPQGDISSTEIRLQESDKKFFDNICSILAD